MYVHKAQYVQIRRYFMEWVERLNQSIRSYGNKIYKNSSEMSDGKKYNLN